MVTSLQRHVTVRIITGNPAFATEKIQSVVHE